MLPAQEPKYTTNADGRLVNRETGSVIPDDEPVFILRARDIHAIPALKHYLSLCEVQGHQNVVESRINDFEQFKLDHPDRMREPGEFRDRVNHRQAPSEILGVDDAENLNVELRR